PKNLLLLPGNNLFHGIPLPFPRFQISNLTEIREILIYPHRALIIFRYPPVLKSMVNGQIQVHSTQKNDIINNAKATKATILHHGLREKFPANDRQRYSLNDRLACHLIYTVLYHLTKRYQKLLHHGSYRSKPIFRLPAF